MLLLLKLLLAHLVGDFILQPRSWVVKKEKHKLRAWQLYVHIVIHGLLIMILVADKAFIVAALILLFSHGIIDGMKVSLQRPRNKRQWFFLDQGLHLLMILIVWYVYIQPEWSIDMFTSENAILYLTIFIFITTPTSLLIKNTISYWTPQSNPQTIEPLENAGKYIGILERIFVVIFILANKWEGVGFLIAAKSIFRFGDLRERNDLKLTEYVLIGTLLSFGIAVVAALIILALRN
jgi:hypothetical protein